MCLPGRGVVAGIAEKAGDTHRGLSEGFGPDERVHVHVSFVA